MSGANFPDKVEVVELRLERAVERLSGKPGPSDLFYVQDVRYVTGAWMRRSDHVQIGDEKSV
jgi:hypothetical protein